LWRLPIALVLISFGYWENFIDENSLLGSLGKKLYKFRINVMEAGTKTKALAGIWKIILTFIFIIIHFGLINDHINLDMIFDTANMYESKCDETLRDGQYVFHSDWLLVVAVQVSAGVLCFYISDLAIKGHLQVPSFTLPMVLATPIFFFLLFWPCYECDKSFNIETDLYWNCNGGMETPWELVADKVAYLGLLIWFPSFILVTRYLWHPAIERLAHSDK
jgi:hypothetical protein